MSRTITMDDILEFAFCGRTDHGLIETLLTQYQEGGRKVGSKTAIKKMKHQWELYNEQYPSNNTQALLWILYMTNDNIGIDDGKAIYKILFKNKKPSEESINKAFTSFLSSKYAK
jgi:hypothetical protein